MPDAYPVDIIIENKVVRVDFHTLSNEDGDDVLCLDRADLNELLTTWKQLDLAHREYRVGDNEAGYSDPDLYIAICVDASGALHVEDIEPLFDGYETYHKYPYDEVNYALGGILKMERAS